MKLWENKFHKGLDERTNDFNSSISFDSRMVQEDIEGSIAHATMLEKIGILKKEEAEAICAELKKIAEEVKNGTLSIDPTCEDIHTFVEGELTNRLGDAGKRLHTARSRNDQVALDIRLYLRNQCDSLEEELKELVKTLGELALKYKE